MPCHDPRDNWDHTHSEELQKLLENIVEVLKERRYYSEDILPFKELSNEATKTLCTYLGEKSPDKARRYSKQLQHWWIDHQDWDSKR